MKLAVLTLLLISSALAGSNSSYSAPLGKLTPEEILKRYTIVADFSRYPAERDVSEEIFWRYPFEMGKLSFDIIPPLKKGPEVLVSHGHGGYVQQINRGRMAYLDGDYEAAKDLFLTAKSRWGSDHDFHRRTDYFIAISFMQLAEKERKEKNSDWQDAEVKMLYSNAATFLNWAFIKKQDIEDTALDPFTPKYLYNLAVIYHRYNRLSGANAIAERGLNFLRKSDSQNLRAPLRQIYIETWIANKSLRKAAQEIDVLIRSENDFSIAGLGFARLGDIYFDLNNYELSEDMYSLSTATVRKTQSFTPIQFILRGESLFWLGKFSEAQKMFSLGISLANKTSVMTPVSQSALPWARLRIADAYLARFIQGGRNNTKLRKQANLDYYRVHHQFPRNDAGKIAGIRRACLELPYYKGNNIRHAREYLKAIKPGDVPKGAYHLASACRVASIAKHERTSKMLDEVMAFYKSHPNSPFIRDLIEPVRSYKADAIYPLFKKNKLHEAIKFFEARRSLLYQKIPLKLSSLLFRAYVDTYNSQKAAEFYAAYSKKNRGSLKPLRTAVFAAEMLTGKQLSRKQKNFYRKLLSDSQKTLLGKKQLFKRDELTESLIMRLRASVPKGRHDEWILKWAESLVENDNAIICTTILPILSRMNRSSKDRKLKDIILSKVALYLEQSDAAKSNDCFSSYLDLEYLILSGRTEQLEDVWLKRSEWPMTPAVASTAWQVADQLSRKKHMGSATKIWKTIAEKSEDGIPEKSLAKIRLDSTRTETEKLWK